MRLQKITPCLWFDSEAEAAASFYCSIFNNARIVRISRYGEAGHEKMMTDADSSKSGRVMTALLKMKKLDIAELKRVYAGQ